MSKDFVSNFAKGSMILAGIVCLAWAVGALGSYELGWGLLVIVGFSMIVAPRMSLVLPRSRFAISFSDAAVFLAFLFYGAPAAVMVSAMETLASCLYLRSRGFHWGRGMIATNISINVVSITATSVAWLYVINPYLTTAVPGTAQDMLEKLGSLAIVHFAVSSFLAAVFQALSDGSSFWATWKRDCFSSSLTQIVGAGVAGVTYKVVNHGDVMTGGIALVTLTIAYLSYRQSIGKVSSAIDEAEASEREKVEVERERRREAELNAEQLAATLAKEERANDALRQSEADLQHAALYDSLTGLPNRRHFGEMLDTLMARYKDDPTATFMVMFLDIRKFKNINDSLGHTLGDKVLMIAAKRFVRMLNTDDMVARIGGDEFAIILRNISTAGKGQKVARRILDSISQPFSLSGNRINITVNIGIAPCDAEYETPAEILRDADIAMHYAREKDSGVAVFTKDLRVRFLERVRYENDLRNAVDRDELSMSYQPIVDLHDGSLIGFEALLRWHHHDFGQVPPNKFIPIAEESGLILPITRWILKETSTQLKAWQQIGRGHENLIVSVNISGKHLSTDDLIDDVENALSLAKLSPSSLKLEITESAMMENAEHTIGMLNRLCDLGVQLSIDDFGTGYSSLSYLHRLPFDSLKIDRSFVISVGENGENSEILQTIISLAKSLKKKVIAEGIETEAQLALLQNLGCDFGQGYLMARPMTRESTENSLYERKSWLPVEITETATPAAAVEENLPVF